MNKLKSYEINALNDFTKIFYNNINTKQYEKYNKGDILSITIEIYYKKRNKHKFKTYDDCIKFLKYATKYAELRAFRLLTDSANNRNDLKSKYIRELIWEMEEDYNEND